MASVILDADGFSVDDGVNPNAEPCPACDNRRGWEPVGVIASRCLKCRAVICDLHGEVLIGADCSCAVCDSGPFEPCRRVCPCCLCRVMQNPAGFVAAMTD